MDGEARRSRLLDILGKEKQPVPGNRLSSRLGVSRQVIVQDIALLRAVNKNILSTNKGYILFVDETDLGRKRQTFKVKHSDAQIEDELTTIVDNGGSVLDVVVSHEIYGQITVDLIINNRVDVELFVANVKKNKTKSLNNLTGGLHYHTVLADCEETLKRVERALDKKGYLIKQ